MKDTIQIACLAAVVAVLLSAASQARGAIVADGDVAPADPATWTGSTDVYIGKTAEGSVTVDGGSSVEANSSYLGYDSGSMGEVAVSGAESFWFSPTMFVGYQGAGNLEISNGGVVLGFFSEIGLLSDSTGRVTVSGSESVWITFGGLRVGGAGDGALNISNGGVVSTGGGVIGSEFDSTGVATVSGEGSIWANYGDLSIGDFGDGALNIHDGGLVSVGGGLTIDRDGGGDSFINMATGGMLALFGDADDSLEDFLGLIDGSDAIRYWDDSISDWADIAGATAGEDYTLSYVAGTGGDLDGYTVLTVSATPEPATLTLLALGGLVGLRRRRR